MEDQKLNVESPGNYRLRKISHYVIYFTITSSSLFYSALMVSLWPYLNHLDSRVDKHFLGFLSAIGALGTTIFCPIFGKWSNYSKSNRIPIFFTLICGILSYIIYVTIELMPLDNRKYWFLLSRILIGLHDINIGLARAYIAESTLQSERRKAVSILTGYQTIAFALGPALQSVLVPLNESGYTFLGVFKIDMYTSIGWLAIISIVITCVLYHPRIFKHSDVRLLETTSFHQINLNNNYRLIAWLFILLQFWLICNNLYLKVLGTPIVMDEFAMNRPDALQYNSWIVTLGAIIALVAILMLETACQRIGEMNAMYIGFIIMIIGRFIMYPIQTNNVAVAVNATDLGCPQWSQSWCAQEMQMYKSQFILSNFLDSFGYSWAITLIYTEFSQILGPKQQGTWMGFMTAFSGLARVISPVFLSQIYATFGNALTVVLTNIIYISLVILTFWLINYHTKRGLQTTGINSTIGSNECSIINENQYIQELELLNAQTNNDK